MGHVISNGPDGVYCGNGWEWIYKLGLFFGWEPQGTELCLWRDFETGLTTVGCLAGTPEESGEWLVDEKWDGNYWSNDGQMMSVEDCEALAKALEDACQEIPDHPLYNATVNLETEVPISGDTSELNDEEIKRLRKSLVFFSDPEAREVLDKVIKVLKKGPCTIN